MICHFTGKFRFLSNFYPCTIRLRGVLYPTVEHAYQAAKTLDLQEREAIRSCSTPGQAKRAGRKATIRPDWEAIKLQVMELALRQKFSQEPLRSLLLLTGQQELIEENAWGDEFWGVCRGHGENHLGRLLMKTRDDLRTP